jgi:hypothetical protein
MLHRPMLTPRSGRYLIALLLVVKLALLVWNAAVFDGKTYDAGYQADRAMFGGLRPGKTAHDPPAYYLAALGVPRPAGVPQAIRETVGEDDEPGEPLRVAAPRPSRAERAFRSELLSCLRYSNVLWLGLFYTVWLFGCLPRLVAGFQPWFLSSLLLLTIPAYQRLGAMSHPDNMFVGTAAVTTALWLLLRERWQAGRAIAFWQLGLFALSIGVMAVTRWLAIVPAAIFSVVCVVYTVRAVGPKLVALAPRLLLLGLLIGAFDLSWVLCRRAAAHEPGAEYAASYFPKLDRDASGFDYRRYYASFHLSRLLERGRAASSDSFPTLVHSEIWGDEWRSFSGSKSKDGRETPRGVLLVVALAVPLTCIVLAVAALVELAEKLKRLRAEASPRSKTSVADLEAALVLIALVTLGAVAFICWQGGPGLLPGDNSSVRFNSIATLFPPAIALLFARPLGAVAFNALSGYFLSLFVLAFPLAMYWPR